MGVILQHRDGRWVPTADAVQESSGQPLGEQPAPSGLLAFHQAAQPWYKDRSGFAGNDPRNDAWVGHGYDAESDAASTAAPP